MVAYAASEPRSEEFTSGLGWDPASYAEAEFLLASHTRKSGSDT